MKQFLIVFTIISYISLPALIKADLFDNEDGTITDTKTGLMWQKNSSTYPLCHCEALEQCDWLNLAGFKDWEMPTEEELLTIVDKRFISPTIDESFFPETQPSGYWVSTWEDERCELPCEFYMSSWQYYPSVNFASGAVESKNDLELLFVRAVRKMRSNNGTTINKPNLGDSFTIGDEMTISWDSQFSDQKVNIYLSRQGGKEGTFDLIGGMVDNDGEYKWTVTEPASVNCTLVIELSENTSKTSVLGQFSVLEEEEPQRLSKAIIVAGKKSHNNDELWNITSFCSKHGYLVLKKLGYSDEDIHFLHPGENIDADDDGNANDVDNAPTISSLYNAITNWSNESERPAYDLMIYMVDHGGDGIFKINPDEDLTSENLNLWLDELQQTLPGELLLIYDACQSGSFITQIGTAPGNKKRYIITSSNSNEAAHFNFGGKLSFSFQFWSGLLLGKNSLFEAFDFAQSIMKGFQTGQLDCNGDGLPNEKTDNTLATNYIIGSHTGSTLPVIQEVCPPQTLNGTPSATIWAKGIQSDNGIKNVFAIINPSMNQNNQLDDPIYDLPVLNLNLDEQNNLYKGEYQDFKQSGYYYISIYAEDMNGVISLPKRTTVFQKITSMERKYSLTDVIKLLKKISTK